MNAATQLTAQAMRNTTKVVLLGTGAPAPGIPNGRDRRPPIVVNDTAHLIDIGPAGKRRFLARGIQALEPHEYESRLSPTFVPTIRSGTRI